MRLIYHVPNVDGISAAWLEVWDRPKRLFRTAVPVKADGQIIWNPDDPYPTTPEMLSLAIYDVELPEFCPPAQNRIHFRNQTARLAATRILAQTSAELSFIAENRDWSLRNRSF